jgi:hypothetical protein
MKISCILEICVNVYTYIYIYIVHKYVYQNIHTPEPLITVSRDLSKISSFKSIASVCYNTTNYNHAKMTIIICKTITYHYMSLSTNILTTQTTRISKCQIIFWRNISKSCILKISYK